IDLKLTGHAVEAPLIKMLIDTGRLARLRTLDLCSNPALGDRAVRLLADTRSPRLEWLGLANTNITFRGLQAVLAAKLWPVLNTLQVNSALLLQRGNWAQTLRQDLLESPLGAQLTNLTFQGVALDTEFLRALVESPLAERLRELCLAKCVLGAEA